ncbi:hypothetical protein Efla_007416 [Eimeria flavescens]
MPDPETFVDLEAASESGACRVSLLLQRKMQIAVARGGQGELLYGKVTFRERRKKRLCCFGLCGPEDAARTRRDVLLQFQQSQALKGTAISLLTQRNSSVFQLKQCDACDTSCRWRGERLLECAVERRGCSEGSIRMRRRKPARFASAALRKLSGRLTTRVGSAALRKLSGRLTTRIQMEADFYAALSGTCELLVSAE